MLMLPGNVWAAASLLCSRLESDRMSVIAICKDNIIFIDYYFYQVFGIVIFYFYQKIC